MIESALKTFMPIQTSPKPAQISNSVSKKCLTALDISNDVETFSPYMDLFLDLETPQKV